MKIFKQSMFITIIIIGLIFVVRFINGLIFSSKNVLGSLDLTDMKAYNKHISGLKVQEIKSGSVNGFRFTPENKKKGVIVTFGGSEGGCDYFGAAHLASKGYEVFALYFFGQDNQKEILNKVPLEFFGEFLRYVKDEGVEIEPLTVIGTSKGAELALVLSNYYGEINNLVLYAPSSYVFQGFDFQKPASSWTYNGKEVPFINLRDSDFGPFAKVMLAKLFNYPATIVNMYESAVKNSKELGAKINIDNFKGKLILFAGGEDKLWHSAAMAKEIYEQQRDKGEIYIYPNAGHAFLPVTKIDKINLGGSVKANSSAKRKSQEELIKFLERNHN